MTDMPELNTYLAGCPNAAADVATVENWAKYWMDQPTKKLYLTGYRNVMANISTIKADIDIMVEDYDGKDFFGAADEAAKIAELALPVETEELLQ